MRGGRNRQLFARRIGEDTRLETVADIADLSVQAYGVDVPTMGNSWHSMKLVVKGDLFTIYMDDKELFKVQDSTFTNAGKVGFWTKADAVSYFDDFKVEKN